MKNLIRGFLRIFLGITIALPSFALRLDDVLLSNTVTSDLLPGQIVSEFGDNQAVIHGFGIFSDIERTAEVKGAWVSIDAISTPNYTIGTAVTRINPGEAKAHFELTRPNNGWPRGNYRFEIYVDGIYYSSALFRISDTPAISQSFGQNNALVQSNNASVATNNNNSPGMSANQLLRGTFCHYSGSSSSSGSYGGTQTITFDGINRWTSGAESSFSSDAGFGYANQAGESGRYQVQNRRILYQTDAGEQGYADINMQQSNGQITEIVLDGDLYSPSLCN